MSYKFHPNADALTFLDNDLLNDYLDSLKADNYVRLHDAYSLGYVKRKIEGIVQPYKGRYGVGYTLHTPAWNTTKYHIITYYVKQED